jgi:hypothetical protein
MKIFRLSDAQTAELGFTHRFEITYADVAAISGTTSGTIALAAYLAGQGVMNAATKLVTAFDGGATSELTLKVGWNGATTDDDDGIIEARSLHADATYITYGDGTGAAFATKRTGYFPLDAGNWEALFTSTGANLSAITSGEVHLYLRLADIRNG